MSTMELRGVGKYASWIVDIDRVKTARVQGWCLTASHASLLLQWTVQSLAEIRSLPPFLYAGDQPRSHRLTKSATTGLVLWIEEDRARIQYFGKTKLGTTDMLETQLCLDDVTGLAKAIEDALHDVL